MDNIDITAQTQDFSPGQSEQLVRTATKDGEWMTISKASEATGLHEKTIRRYIKARKFKSKRIGSSANSPILVFITNQSLKAVYAEATIEDEYETEDSCESSAGEDPAPETQQHNLDIESIFRSITQQFADKLDQQTQVIYELRQEVVEKDRQLRLLPDLQKGAEEKAQAEKEALSTKLEQVEAELAAVRAQNEELLKKKKGWLQWFFGTGN